MPPTYFPLRWESTGEKWWYASPIDLAAASGHYNLVRELLHLDFNLIFQLTSLRRIRRLETVWDDDAQFDDVAQCRSQVAHKLFLDCELKKGHNSLIRAGYGGWLLYTAVSAGDMGFVKELLKRESFLVFGEGEYGVTDILYAAARSKSSEIFKFLFDFAVSERSFTDDGGEPEGKVEEAPSVFRMEMMNRALHAAARGGNLEILTEFLGECSEILVYRDSLGSTLLHTASGRGQIEIVKYLVTSYDIINSKDNQGNTALHVAAYRGYLVVIEYLVSNFPSSTSLTNNCGETFLHMAVAGFRTPAFKKLDLQVELVKQLVCGNIVNIEDIINEQNEKGSTALHMAVTENIPPDLLELLMSVPAINFNITDINGKTPLDLLRQRLPSMSSEILMLNSARGITSWKDYMSRNALVSNLKMQGIRGSPGTSFSVTDAEIVLYTDIDRDHPSTESDTSSGELSQYNSSDKLKSLENIVFDSVNYADKHLKILPQWQTEKDRKFDEGANMGNNDDLLELYSVNGALRCSQISLRERYSKHSSLTNKKTLPNQSNLPSSSAKKKFNTGLIHGVLKVTPQFGGESPSSQFSETSGCSPVSLDNQKGVRLENNAIGASGSSSSVHKENRQVDRRHGSPNKRLMNRYFRFGTQGLAVEDSVSCT